MSNPANTILHGLMRERAYDPLTRAEADEIAAQWHQVAIDNGSSVEELETAAGDDIVTWLLRTFGEQGQQVVI